MKNLVLLFILAKIFSRVCKTCCSSFEEPSENLSSDMDPSSRKMAPPSSPIINGIRAGDHEFPYIVAVRSASYPSLPFGMGSIVREPGSSSGDSRWIITCRHIPGDLTDLLTKPKLTTPKLVVLPKYNNNWRELEKHRKYKVKNAYCHPWPKSQKNPDDDIALLELEEKIPLNKPDYHFKSIPLVDKNFHLSPNEKITVAGWGYNQTRQKPGIPDYLMKADIRMISTPDCQKFYHDFPEKLWFCAGQYKNGKTKTICDGDSGAPAVFENSGGDHSLVGVVSGSDGPCDKPAVFMNISHYRDWVEKVMTTRPKKMLCTNLLNDRPA